MRKLFGLLTLLVFLSPWAEAKPYRRVLVLLGGGLNSPISLGIYDAVTHPDSPWKPDLVITSCGHSVTSFFIRAIPDQKERYAKVIDGGALHDLYRSIVIDEKTVTRPRLIAELRAMLSRKALPNAERPVPDYFGPGVLTVPYDLASMPESIRALGQGLRIDDEGQKILMIGSRLTVTKNDVNRKVPGKRLVETYFTGSQTAAALKDYKSPSAKLHPESFIEEVTATIENPELFAPTRISLSDPFYLNATPYQNDFYLGGAADLHPIELAQFLGDEVTMIYPGPMGGVEELAYQDAFGFDNNARVRAVRQMPVTHWIDTSDIDAIYDRVGFNPQANISLGDLAGRALKGLFGNAPKNEPAVFVSRVPEKREDFNKRAKELYDYGYSRAHEAIRAQKGTQDYIRVKPVVKKAG
jgi:hypothetical protein